jgi:hypothetical protein
MEAEVMLTMLVLGQVSAASGRQDFSSWNCLLLSFFQGMNQPSLSYAGLCVFTWQCTVGTLEK